MESGHLSPISSIVPRRSEVEKPLLELSTMLLFGLGLLGIGRVCEEKIQ